MADAAAKTTKATKPPTGAGIDERLRLYLKELGRKGGRSKSKAKMDAALVNVEKANEARWGKRFAGRIAKGRRK
jgi:hypothetical protein